MFELKIIWICPRKMVPLFYENIFFIQNIFWHGDAHELQLLICDIYEIENAFVLCNLTISSINIRCESIFLELFTGLFF